MKKSKGLSRYGRSFFLWLTLGLGFFFQLGWAIALEVPPLSTRVNDYAGMLSPATRQQLEYALAELEKSDSTQLAVLTITSLEGENLEDFSLKVVEQWKLGQKRLDNGALLLIAKNDRKLRIEVGYGLEGVLTDLQSARIIRDIITPQFRNGNFDQGVIDGVSAMIAVVRGEFNGKDVVDSGAGLNGDTAGFMLFLLFALFNIGRMLGRNKMMAATIGSVVAPVIGSLFLGPRWPILLALIPGGFFAAYLASLLLANFSGPSGRPPGGYGGYSSGGFGGGGFSGGGGGGFGGGGSSGSW